MNNIDQLFKNKLDNYETTPSLDAWSKIESGLTKKNKGALWMKIAASIMLFMAVGIIYQQVNSPKEDIVQIANNTTPKNGDIMLNSTSSINEIEEKIELPTTTLESNAAETAKTSTSTKSKIAELKSNVTNEIVTKSLDKNKSTLTEDKKEPAQNNTNNILEIATDELIASYEKTSYEPKEKNTSIKIVYNLEPVIKVDSSILEKKTIENNAKDNVFGKIVAFAKNAKSSDVSLGNLRAAKDDFLSLDNLKSSVQNPK